METMTQRYKLEGKTKPNVRANKRYSKDPKAKAQYAEYRLCLENYTSQAWVQRQQQGAYMIEKGKPLAVLVNFFLHQESLFKSDIDNLLKTVFDSMSGVVFEDDRYITMSSQHKLVIPDEQEPYVLVTVMDLSQWRSY